MGRQAMSFTKGMGTGIIVGAVIAVVAKCVIQNRKCFGKKTKKIMRAVGDVMDNISTIMK